MIWNTETECDKIDCTYIEVPNGKKYVEAEDKRTRGTVSLKWIVWNYTKIENERTQIMVWKHKKSVYPVECAP